MSMDHPSFIVKQTFKCDVCFLIIDRFFMFLSLVRQIKLSAKKKHTTIGQFVEVF